MTKYIISWDVGYGRRRKIVEAEKYEGAYDMAYDAWFQEMELQADFSAEEYTEEEAKRLGLEDN